MNKGCGHLQIQKTLQANMLPGMILTACFCFGSMSIVGVERRRKFMEGIRSLGSGCLPGVKGEQNALAEIAEAPVAVSNALNDFNGIVATFRETV